MYTKKDVETMRYIKRHGVNAREKDLEKVALV